MNCTVCNGYGTIKVVSEYYMSDRIEICKNCDSTGKVHTMSRTEVYDLMISSKSPEQWNRNAEKVKASFEGTYPYFWSDIIVIPRVLQILQEIW